MRCHSAVFKLTVVCVTVSSPSFNRNKLIAISEEYGRYQEKIEIIVKQGLTKNMIALVLGGALIFITIVLLVSFSKSAVKSIINHCTNTKYTFPQFTICNSISMEDTFPKSYTVYPYQCHVIHQVVVVMYCRQKHRRSPQTAYDDVADCTVATNTLVRSEVSPAGDSDQQTTL